MKNAAIGRTGYIPIIFGVFILLGLYLASLYSYLLFHSIAEMFSIIVACGIFMIAWNSRNIMDNNYLLFLGIAYLYIGGLDFVHTLAYKGMGVFPEHGANLSTQLWIAARYIESLSLLIALFFLNRRLIAGYGFLGFFLAVSFVVFSIFVNVFPVCFIEGSGLTPFKKVSEYIISLILIGSIVVLVQKRNEFDGRIFRLLVSSIILTICAEVMFTFYISVYGLSNLIGHYFKLVSFYLIYKAIIESGLKKPYDLLFRKLKKSEELLRQDRNNLQKAFSEIKTLRGILPICSSCKKIRNDKGYWDVIEDYLREHSEAEFSHGICPECAKRLYPDLDIFKE